MPWIIIAAILLAVFVVVFALGEWLVGSFGRRARPDLADEPPFEDDPFEPLRSVRREREMPRAEAQRQKPFSYTRILCIEGELSPRDKYRQTPSFGRAVI